MHRLSVPYVDGVTTTTVSYRVAFCSSR
jgi:hypothetical protein